MNTTIISIHKYKKNLGGINVRKLSKYLKPHILFVILAPLSMILEVISELLLPQIMSKIVNIGIANENISYVLLKTLLMLLIALIGIFGGVGCGIFASKASQNFGRDLRLAMFKKIQTFSFVNIDKFHTSSLITRLTNDVTQVQQIVIMLLRMLIRAPFLFIGSLFMAYTINPNLTNILFFAVIILIIAVIFIVKKGAVFFKIVQEKLDSVNTVIRENLSGVRVVKAFVRGDLEQEKFKKSNEELKYFTIKSFKIMSTIIPIMMIILNITIVLVLWFGGKYIESGTMKIGDLMAYITYITQILMSLMMTGMAIMMLSRGAASIGRINDVLDTKPDIKNIENPLINTIKEGEIEFKNVSFKYPESSGDMVLENINFKAKKGETIGILGETGSGKSTFVNLIPRLYDVTEGEILIDGKNIKDIDLSYLRNEIGIVLQKAILFSSTIKENIKWGKKDASDEDIYVASKKAQAYDFIMDMPDKFDTKLGQMGINLSGGQKQRISIARTIIKNPKILILDDSTSAVDNSTEAKIQKALKEMKNTTKLIIAQKISSIIHSDKIIIISDGKIIASGNHKELIKTSGIYKDIYNSQIRGEDL